MTFEEYCKQNNDSIYAKICKYLPRRAPEEHYQIVRDYSERRGKYWRPNLALLWCELYGGKKEDIFLFACAIQVAEDWILMHDDWMDESDLRRGKPTAHLLYGDKFAMNAGDALHMVMWKMAHDASQRPDPRRGERLFEAFYDMLLITIAGQYYDLKLASEKNIIEFELDDYWQSIHAKAAYYSVYGPMQLGALSAGAAPEIVESIKEYGVPLGKAFQVVDDILNCISTPEVLGKTIGNDIYEGTKTPILWHFVRNAKVGDLEFVKNIYAKERKEKTPEEVQHVITLFKATGSIAFAQGLVNSFAQEALQKFEEQARDILESGLKDTARDALRKMIHRLK